MLMTQRFIVHQPLGMFWEHGIRGWEDCQVDTTFELQHVSAFISEHRAWIDGTILAWVYMYVDVCTFLWLIEQKRKKEKSLRVSLLRKCLGQTLSECHWTNSDVRLILFCQEMDLSNYCKNSQPELTPFVLVSMSCNSETKYVRCKYPSFCTSLLQLLTGTIHSSRIYLIKKK